MMPKAPDGLYADRLHRRGVCQARDGHAGVMRTPYTRSKRPRR